MEAGQLIAGRYRLERRLGRGSIGDAWAARDAMLDVEVALKRVEGPDVGHLRREFALLRGRRHPHLARALDFGWGRHAGAPFAFFTSDLVREAQPFDAFAQTTPDPQRHREALVGVVRALGWLHRLGIRHGDVRADNLLVAPDGRATVVDLSCAGPIGALVRGGTPSHLPPEALEGRALDGRADLYSLGVVLERCALDGPLAALGDRLRAPLGARPADAAEVLERLGATDLGGAPSARAPELLGRDGRREAFEQDLARLLAGDAVAPVVLAGPAGSGRTRLYEELRFDAQRRVARCVEGRDVTDLLRRATGSERSGLALLEAALERAEGPAVWCVDAPPGDALLAPLLRAPERPGVLVLAVDRGAEQGLEPLDERALRAWCEALDLAQTDLAALARDTAGMPGAVERWLCAKLGGPPAQNDPGEVATLPEAARDALAVLSLLGGEAPLARLESLGLDPSALLERGWVRAHAASAHLARAEWLDPLLRAVEPERLARHAERLLKRAAPTEAALVAARHGRPAEAFARLLAAPVEPALQEAARRALALPSPSAAVRRHAAAILLAAGHPQDAQAALTPLDADAETERLRADAALKLGRVDEVLTRLEGDDSPFARDRRARARVAQGRYAEARAEAQAAIDRGGLAPALRARLLESVGLCAAYLGEADAAIPLLEDALRQHDADPAGRARALSYLGLVEFRRGGFAEAARHYRAVVETARAHGLDDQLAPGWLNVGAAAQEGGDWGEALEAYARAQRFAQLSGELGTEAHVCFNLANLYAEIGTLDRATHLAERAGELGRRLGQAHLEAPLLRLSGELARARGELASADALLARAEERFSAAGSARDAAECRLLRAQAARDSGDPRAAARHLQRIEPGDAEDLGLRRDLLAIELGAEPGAVRALEALAERARAAKLERVAARVDAALADAYDARGLGSLAAERRDAARRTFERFAATLPGPQREAFFAHPERAPLFDRPQTSAPERRGAGADAERLARFLEVNRALNETLDTERVLAAAVDAAVALTGAQRGFVLRRGDAAELDVVAARTVEGGPMARSHLEFSRSIAADVIAHDRPVLTVDAATDDRFRGERSVHTLSLSSVACVPIRSPGGVLGALYLDNRVARGRFAEGDLELLLAFADQVSVALRNAELHSALAARTRSLEQAEAALRQTIAGQAARIEDLAREVADRQEALEYRYDYSQIIGRSAPMRAVLATMERLIESDLSVLIEGESGTGKELVARAIHVNGHRKAKRMVSLNCAALPETLLESELFGHVRGAFTGAERDRAGLLESADGGTVFLDELGEMPASVQAKLLRALQEREVWPVGAEAPRKIDVRLLCATNRQLDDEVAAGRFRADLFYRVSVVRLTLPPLRERPEDVADLVAHFLSEHAPDKSIEPRARRALTTYAWPGNVRQLENVIARAALLSAGSRIGVDDLDLPAAAAAHLPLDREEHQLDERARVLGALTRTNWNVSRAARELGFSRQTLYRKLRAYRLERR